MSEHAFIELIVLAGVAGGLVLLGLSRVALARRSVSVRLTATTTAVLAPAALPAGLGYPAAAAFTAGVVAAAALVAAVLGSSRVMGAVAAVLRQLGRPAVQAGALAAAGGAVLVGSLARFDRAAQAQLETDMAYMNQVTWKPPLRPVDRVATAAGRSVGLFEAREVRPAAEVAAAERPVLDSLGFGERMIRIAPAADGCNCHGWVFTGGRYWVGGDEVNVILADEGYQPVSQPRAGDVVIYREGERITHTAVVRTAEPGGPVLVEGKWGWMGVFLHPPEGSCYGRQFTYYRGPRTTHILAGLAGAPGRTTVTAAVNLPAAPDDMDLE